MDSKSTNHDSLRILEMFRGIKDNEDIQELYKTLEKNQRNIKWKEMEDTVKEVMYLFLKKRIYVTDLKKESSKCYRYKGVLEELIKGCRKAKILKLFMPDLVEYCLNIFEEKCFGLFEGAEEAAKNTTEITLKDHREAIFAALVKVNKILRMPGIQWEETKYGKRGLLTVTENLLKAIGECRNLTEKEGEILAQLSLTILQSDLMDRKREKPDGIYFDMFDRNLGMLLKLTLFAGQLEKQTKIVELFLDFLTHEETQIYTQASYYLNDLGANSGPILAPYLGRLLEAFFENEQWNLISIIQFAYPNNPEPMEEHFQTLFEYIESPDRNITSNLVMFLPHIARKQPQLFTEDNIETLIETMYTGDINFQSLFLMGIEPIVAKRPKLFTNQIDKLLDIPYNEYAYYYHFKILGTYSSKATEKEAEKILKFFLEVLKENEDGNKRVHAAMQIKVIVSSYRSLVEKYKDLLEQTAKEEISPHTKDQIIAVIDVLEGRSLETLADDIEQHQDDLDNLDSRVTVNENSINTVKDDVMKQSQQSKLVRKDAEDLCRGFICESVNGAELKVEKTENRTLSHAPYWSRDVSKLMNPAADADWRLLSSRLGYSNDDIRAWAQQSDPCMAMLNEWYATHKTSEASYGILTSLQEMDRMDAAIIVENAMKAAVKDLITKNKTRFKNIQVKNDLRSQQIAANYPGNTDNAEGGSFRNRDDSRDRRQCSTVPGNQRSTNCFHDERTQIPSPGQSQQDQIDGRSHLQNSLEKNSRGLSKYLRQEQNRPRHENTHLETRERFFSTEDDTFDICDIPAHFDQFSRDVHGRIDTLSGRVSEVHARFDDLECEMNRRDISARFQTLEQQTLPSFSHSIQQRLDQVVTKGDLQVMFQEVQSSLLQSMSEQLSSVNRELQSMSEQFSLVNRELQSLRNRKGSGSEIFI